MIYFFIGYKVLRISQDAVTDFLELCRCRGYAYDDFSVCPEGDVILKMKTPTAKEILAWGKDSKISIEVLAEGGFPVWIRRLFKRPGLCLGTIAAILLMVLSSRFVWDIRVSGNTHLTEQEIEETLQACGFGVGSYLGTFKADRTENKALMANSNLSWISINMKGTVAYVQVRESVSPPETQAELPANLVADTGGQIVHIELVRGNVVVSAGQWVGKGDLLVSGLYDSEQVGFRYTHAEGRVYARVVEEITVTIPLEYEKKVYNTAEKDVICEKSLIFFKKYIKFSKKTGNIEGSCDIIKRVSVPFSEWGVDFPVSLVTEWYLPYTAVTEKRTYAEAEALAYHELSKKIGSLQGGAQVLDKTITTTLGEDVYILRCSLTCIRDIAKEQTFEVVP